ncbi:MAG: ATP-dependent helicase [Phycisphaerales bacterium]
MSSQAEGEGVQTLNSAQAAAVRHDLGPLVVLAGPGTGKTGVIIHRIAHTIRERGADPENVLAVTFTVKAAEEMRSRVAGLLGAATADRVHVHTFHGLGVKILERFAGRLGYVRPPVLIDSSQQRTLVRDLIREHNLFRPMLAQGIEQEGDRARSVIEALNNDSVSPARARGFAVEWLMRVRGLPAAERTPETEAQEAEAAWLVDCATLAEKFTEACRVRSWITYADLIRLPIEILGTNGGAAAIVRGEYRHVVVDEFQDVNGAQIELLSRLCPHSVSRPPDLCVVGDDDQSIYRFRGADDRAFARFSRMWPGHAKVTLSENYRSEKCIIDAANYIISLAGSDRYEPEKRVERPVGSAAAPAVGAAVEVAGLSHYGLDGDIIAAMIMTERAANPERAFREFAVIAKSHADLARVASALEMEGIPTQRVADRNALLDEGVQDVMEWARLLVDQRRAASARRILLRPPCSVPLDVVLVWERAFANARVIAAKGRGDDPGAFPMFLAAWKAAGTSPWHAGADLFLRLFEELAAETATSRADRAFLRIMQLADPAHADLLDGRERAQRVSALVQVLRFVRSRQDRVPQPGDLHAFLSYYEDLAQDEQEFRGRDDGVDAAGEANEADRNAVQLCTAHASKGLEFDTVFVTRIGMHGFGAARRNAPLLPEGLVDRLGDTRTPAAQQAAEERRLFYVACTRAKRRLILLGKLNKSRSKSVNYLDEFLRDQEGRGLAVARSEDDVMRAASEARVGPAARGEIERAAGDLRQLSSRRAILAGARRTIRMRAAAALAAAAGGAAGADEESVALATKILGQSAAMLAVTAEIEREGAAPEWASRFGSEVQGFGEAMIRQLAGAGRAEGPMALRALQPPLSLSFTTIENYLACPGCQYVRMVLELPEESERRMQVGGVVHKALQLFYEQVRDADSDGRPLPTLADLIALAREVYFVDTAGTEVLSEDAWQQIEAQLTRMHERLFDPTDHVLECEKKSHFAYECGGHTHKINVRMDRKDQLPSGGWRIIDYKTGGPSKAKLEPKADDLQLGIYLLALQAEEGPEVDGVAEYWVLSTGERGSIEFSAIDIDKVKGKIDEAIVGMLKGDWPSRGKRCGGLCALLSGGDPGATEEGAD